VDGSHHGKEITLQAMCYYENAYNNNNPFFVISVYIIGVGIAYASVIIV
jgi:hypothetical protein